MMFTCYFVENHGLPYFETSAKEGINVEKAFETVARNALLRDKDNNQPGDFPMPIRINQSDTPSPQNKSCSC